MVFEGAIWICHNGSARQVGTIQAKTAANRMFINLDIRTLSYKQHYRRNGCTTSKKNANMSAARSLKKTYNNPELSTTLNKLLYGKESLWALASSILVRDKMICTNQLEQVKF